MKQKRTLHYWDDRATIKKMADVVLNENPFPIKTLGYEMAERMIGIYGYYAYKNSKGEKTFLELSRKP